ncbi:formate--tetrahydrofolate ligase [Propioniciclava flava]
MKLRKLATLVYGAADVELTPAAAADLRRFAALGYAGLPVLVAKTHLLTTATPADRGAPTGWVLPIREVRLSAAGAGDVYALACEMQTMPGLGAHPAAERMDLTDEGRIVGLF